VAQALCRLSGKKLSYSTTLYALFGDNGQSQFPQLHYISTFHLIPTYSLLHPLTFLMMITSSMPAAEKPFQFATSPSMCSYRSPLCPALSNGLKAEPLIQPESSVQFNSDFRQFIGLTSFRMTMFTSTPA